MVRAKQVLAHSLGSLLFRSDLDAAHFFDDSRPTPHVIDDVLLDFALAGLCFGCLSILHCLRPLNIFLSDKRYFTF
jgi:hypothetical protein